MPAMLLPCPIAAMGRSYEAPRSQLDGDMATSTSVGPPTKAATYSGY